MIIFPNAKINIGLRIGGKRTDGYHNLQTIFYPVPLYDVLEILPLKNKREDLFTQSGIHADLPSSQNLVNKAVQILRNQHFNIPPLQIHLHKNIPMGAGLGGGSSDASFTLMLLNKLFNLNISKEGLLDYALQLGSDCPFFIINQPAAATGRGEELQPVNLSLKEYRILLVLPGIHISTAESFGALKKFHSDHPADYISLPIETWKGSIFNDFEEHAFHTHPELTNIKEELYNNGAVYAAMSGTGSTFFGIFKEIPQSLKMPGNYRQIII